MTTQLFGGGTIAAGSRPASSDTVTVLQGGQTVNVGITELSAFRSLTEHATPNTTDDQSAAINQALTDAASDGHTAVVVPPVGFFTAAATINIPAGMTLLGHGDCSEIRRAAAFQNGALIKSVNTVRPSIAHLRLTNAAPTPARVTDGYGINFQGTTRGVVRSVLMEDQPYDGVGFDTLANSDGIIEGVDVYRGHGHSIQFTGNTQRMKIASCRAIDQVDGAFGFVLGYASASTFSTDAKLRDLEVINSGISGAFQLNWLKGAQVSGLRGSNVNSGVMILDSDECQVSNVLLHDVAPIAAQPAGVIVTRSDNNDLTDVTIRNITATYHAFRVLSTSDGNKLTNCRAPGATLGVLNEGTNTVLSDQT